MIRGRVLVVDDKENFRSLFRRILPPDLAVACAADGDAALELLEKESFDVVVSDVRMPKRGGFGLLDAISERELDVAVVLMTAYGTIPDAVAAMKRGVVEYLTKPFTPADAVRAVEEALARQRGKANAAEQLPYRETLASERGRATRDYLVRLLQDAHGNVTHAAHKAGIERESLHRLLKRHSIRAQDYRAKK